MPVPSASNRSCSCSFGSSARSFAVASAIGVPCSTSSSAWWIDLPSRVSGMTSGSVSLLDVPEVEQPRAAQRHRDLGGRPRGMDQRARRRHAVRGSRKLATGRRGAYHRLVEPPSMSAKSATRASTSCAAAAAGAATGAGSTHGPVGVGCTLHDLQREAPALPEGRGAVRQLEADVLQLRRSGAPSSIRCRPTVAGLKEAISRERRKRDRRFGKPDTRVFRYERRVGERRAGATTVRSSTTT